MKKSSYTTRNQTRDLLVCSAVPQPNAPLCAPHKWGETRNLNATTSHPCSLLQFTHPTIF